MMKKLLFSVLLLLMTAIGAVAQTSTITVNDGDVTNQTIPLDGFNADGAQHNQMLYLASDLSAMAGQEITEMVFYFNGSYGSNSSSVETGRLGTWTISLGETDATTLSSLDNSTTTSQVYQGIMTWDHTALTLTITFDNSYVYNGGNLLVDFDHAAASWNRYYFLGVETAESMSYNSGAKNFSPKTTFVYQPLPTCPKPATATATNITSVSADIAWTPAGSESEWALKWGVAGFDVETAGTLVENLNAASYSLTGLTGNTEYDVYVKAVCGEGDESIWKSVSFRTACDAITTFPWSENFDGYTIADAYTPSSRTLPTTCWNYINECTNSSYKYYPTIYYYSYTDYSHSTPNSLRLYSYYSSWSNSDPQPQYAVLPAMENLNTKRLVFWARGYDTNSTFKVGLMTDPTDANTFVLVGEEQTLTTSYQPYTINLTGSGNYIAIMIDAANSSRSSNGMYIDDITVMEQPSCMEPTALSASNVLAREATLSWTAGASETAWQICLNDDEDNLINADSNPFTLTGLTPETNYQVKVRAKCSESDFSEWTSNVSFTTTVSCPVPTALTCTGVTATTATLSWTAGAGETAWQICLDNDEEHLIDADANPFTLEGLTAETVYTAKVRAVCGVDDESAWSAVCNFEPTAKIIIGSGTASNADLPTNSYYKNELSQQIYTASEIGGSYNFSSIDFYNGGTEKTRNLDVYLVNTDKASFADANDWITVTADDKVFSGEVTFTANVWTTIAFASDFYYDGVSNLAVIVDDNTGDYSRGMNCRVFNAENQAIYVQSDNTNYDPTAPSYSGTRQNVKNQIRLLGTPAEPPACVRPTNLTATNITARTADLSWAAGADETAWQICISNTPGSEDIIDVATNPYTLNNLNPETTYLVKVRAKCSESDYSEWTSNISFTTTVACPVPTALVFSDITNNYVSMSWTAGSSESRWNLQYKKSSEEDWGDVIEVTTNPITNISGLDAGTTYNVRVQADCELDGTSTVWLTGSFSTAYGIPFLEEFATATIPANWSKYQGLLSDVIGGTAYTSTTSGWYFTSVDGVMNGYHAKVNIFGTSCKYWLVTPTIVMDANVQLTFDLALTDYGNADPIEDPTAQADDKFVVLISTDNGATWTILRQYDNAGSEFVYNNIPTAGEEVAIDLSSYATDNVIIAFYGESTASGGDNDLRIDNVSLDYRRSCTKPTALTVSNVLARTADLAWTAGADETAWQICLNDVEDDEHLINVNGEPSYTLTGLTPEYAYTVKVRANCGGDVSAWTANSSFTTAVSCPAPTALAATLTPGNGSVATLAWTENGTATAWTLEYGTAADFAGAISVDVNETPSAELTGLTAETTYYARVRTVCGVDDESAWSDVINFTPTDAYAITLNDGTTTNSYVPVYGLYVDDHSRSQFIIPASALTALQWGTINKLTFYSSNTSVNWGAAQFDVRLKEVNNTTFENSTLEDWNNMSLVYNGSLTISDNIMEITFSTPYTYMGGNLMIGTNCIVNGTYASCSWYGVSADGASLGGYNTSISQRNFLPKVTIEYTPGAEPTCYVPTALAASNVTNESATITWTVGASETAWQICINNNEEELINVTETSYTLNDLTAATTYSVKVRANCGEGDVSAWSTVMFTTNLCADEDMCQISYELSDPSSYGYGWFGAAINVIDAETDEILATWTLASGESTTGTLSVCNGRDITFEWVEGYYDDVTAYAVFDVNGDEIFSGEGAMVSPVNYTVICSTEPNTYTITATAGENGTIDPASAEVMYGYDKTFTITPDEGYRIATVVVDAETEGEANVTENIVAGDGYYTYTFTNVTANHTIHATFEAIPTYTITVEAGENGNVYYNDALVSDPIVVTEGATPEFEITPATGYQIDVLTVGGNTIELTEQQLGGFTYTFEPVRADITLAVTFTFVNSADMIEAGSLSIYPNPNNGMFSIDFSNIEGDATYQIIDARGAVVETRDINVMNGETMNFNHDLRPGAYFVRIINGDKVYVEQIVVE